MYTRLWSVRVRPLLALYFAFFFAALHPGLLQEGAGGQRVAERGSRKARECVPPRAAEVDKYPPLHYILKDVDGVTHDITVPPSVYMVSTSGPT